MNYEQKLQKVGVTLSHIRKSKGWNISSLVGSKMARSTYNRFITGETYISLDNFLFLIHQMHVTPDEFVHINNDYQEDDISHYMYLLKHAVLNNDIDTVSSLTKTIELICQHNTNEEFKHLYCLFRINESYMSNQPINKNDKAVLKNYLANIEQWHYYEFMLFNYAMFIFQPEQIEFIINKMVFSTKNNFISEKYMRESVELLIHSVYLSIDNNEFVHAQSFLSKLKKIRLKEEMLLEKNTLFFLDAIMQLIFGNEQAQKQAQKSIMIFKCLKADNYQNHAERYLRKIIMSI